MTGPVGREKLLRIAEEAKQAGVLNNALLLLPLVQFLLRDHDRISPFAPEARTEQSYLHRSPTVVHIPRKRRQLHDENHLRTCNLECFVAHIEEGTNNVAKNKR